MSWLETAERYIREAHEKVPKDATLKERMKIIDAAYPFYERKYHPYKQWLKARKSYLNKYDQKPMTWGDSDDR